MSRLALSFAVIAVVLAGACSDSGSDAGRATSSSGPPVARPCLPPEFGTPVSTVDPAGVPLPPNPSSVFEHTVIQALPCAFTGLEILDNDPTSMAVHVAPLTDVERSAIAKVATQFPNYKLVPVEARQSLAEANAQIAAINAVLHRDSTVGMGADGQVTVTVYGVAKGDEAKVEAEIRTASQQVPAGRNALPPIVNITSGPSGFSQ